MVPCGFYILFKKKKNKTPQKSVVGLKALIYRESSWPIYDIPSGVFWLGFFFPYLPFLSKQLLPLPYLLAVSFLPLHQTSKPELPRRCLITQHCSGDTSTLLFWWLPAVCLLSASPALPRWLFAGPSSSFANRCHFCLLRCWKLALQEAGQSHA